MHLCFPEVYVVRPQYFRALTVCPLITKIEPLEYILALDAVNEGLVEIREVGKEGSVSDLHVVNRSHGRVLFLEGEHLCGAKQDRVVNTSVLVGGSSQCILPVSCVEQGRWSDKGVKLFHAEGFSRCQLRGTLKRSVTDSLQRGERHRSNQIQVWADVSEQQASGAVHSTTGAMSDTLRSKRSSLRRFRKSLKCPEGCTGFVIFVAGRFASLDLFNKSSTCKKMWGPIITGTVVDWLDKEGPQPDLESLRLPQIIRSLREANWTEVDAVSLGQEYRAGNAAGDAASALYDQGRLLHLSMTA